MKPKPNVQLGIPAMIHSIKASQTKQPPVDQGFAVPAVPKSEEELQQLKAKILAERQQRWEDANKSDSDDFDNDKMHQHKKQKHQSNRNNVLAKGQKYRGGRPVKKPKATMEGKEKEPKEAIDIMQNKTTSANNNKLSQLLQAMEIEKKAQISTQESSLVENTKRNGKQGKKSANVAAANKKLALTRD